jgi:ribosome maturation factor RimP
VGSAREFAAEETVARVLENEIGQRVDELSQPVLTEMGLELVEIVFRRNGRRWLLRLDIDRPGPEGVGVEDCQRVSQALAAALDEADLVSDSYVLEVSSPGIDRPIRTDDDIRRNTGRRVVVETEEPPSGRREFRGVLLGQNEGELRLAEEGGNEIRIPRERIVRAYQEMPF